MLRLLRFAIKALLLVALVAWLFGCTTNPAALSLAPAVGLAVDDCREFAAPRSAEGLCRLKTWALAGGEERQRLRKLGQPVRYACTRTLTKPNCAPVEGKDE
jgi:hypothetical protein